VQTIHPSFSYYGNLQKVHQYVLEHYQLGTIRLEEAAEIACLETKYFSKFFHKKVGIRFSVWIRSFRIAEAVKLMGASERSITELAYLVGFGDVRTFERAFKKEMHICPKAYRDILRPKRHEFQVLRSEPTRKERILSQTSHH
jgi:AraC-like DNA-binding protein